MGRTGHGAVASLSPAETATRMTNFSQELRREKMAESGGDCGESIIKMQKGGEKM